MTHIGGDRERGGCYLLTSMWQVALLGPGGNRTGFSGFAARCQSSEGCYLSRWEVLEVVEGQVSDQVSSVPDEWLMTSGDVEGGQNLAVPQAKCSPLIQGHLPQISVNSLPPRKNTITETCDILARVLCNSFIEYLQTIVCSLLWKIALSNLNIEEGWRWLFIYIIVSQIKSLKGMVSFMGEIFLFSLLPRVSYLNRHNSHVSP